MSNQTGFADAVGTFIDAWAGDIVETYKNIVPILADSKMTQMQEVGGVYNVATRLTFEGGQTFAAPQTQPGDSGLPYVGPRAGFSPAAKVEGMQIHGRSRVTYEAIARSMQSVDANAPNKKKAVQAATKIVCDGLMQGTLKKAETLMLHGREGLGQQDTAVLQSNVVANTYTDNGVAAAGFNCDFSLSPATWAEAIWAAFEGHTFDIYSDASGLPSTKLNMAPNSLLSGTNQTGCVLQAINPATPLTNGTASGRVIRLWHSSGTAGALGTGVLGGYTGNATPGNANQSIHIMFESSSPTVDFVGLGLMAQNSGTLFSISAASYGMWRGNLNANVGNIRLSELIRYLKSPINHGAQGATIRAVVPTELFAQFANDESTLRRYSIGSGDAQNGFSSLEMYLPHKGKLEILGHTLQKDGNITCYVPDELIRVGAQEIDFVNRAGQSGKSNILVEVQNSPASEIRLYGQFAPIVSTPRHMLRLTGVTY